MYKNTTIKTRHTGFRGQEPLLSAILSTAPVIQFAETT